MKFSVIIPLCNKEQTIGRAMKSVLAQTHGELEIIIADDGSTDGSVAAAWNYTDPRLRVIRHNNAGISAACNNNIAAQADEFVNFRAADNVRFPGFLAHTKGIIAPFTQDAVYMSDYL
ncbi:MAG TPA: glycosyltransferase [Clostridiales bacterium]|nr:glycosyltransferase [Clostridiales bacterium]